MTLKTAVFLSGSGRTLQNLLDLPDLPIQIALVVSSDPDAYGLTRARERGIPTKVEERKAFDSHAAYSQALFKACRDQGCELVLLAGFLKLLRPIPEDFQGKVLNIHPALIPAFCGKGYYGERVHRAVIESGVKVTGCTVHFVDDQYDHGPIVLQRVVEVLEDDDPHTLADRVFEAELQAYPEAIRLFAAGRLEIDGRKVRVR